MAIAGYFLKFPGLEVVKCLGWSLASGFSMCASDWCCFGKAQNSKTLKSFGVLIRSSGGIYELLFTK